jgi:hypothetical protein
MIALLKVGLKIREKHKLHLNNFISVAKRLLGKGEGSHDWQQATG